MKPTYAILGAGMQGTAAAYDLARFANPERICLADASLEQATRSARRVNDLVGREICFPYEVDALDAVNLGAFLKNKDVLLSCVPYWMHPKIAGVAISSGTHMCDLGGDTTVTLKTLELDEKAKAAGVTLIPDTGLAPGLVNSIGKYILEQLDSAETVRLFCGVLPQHPKPPFNYKTTFNIEGLVAEYDDEATVLRNGEVVFVPTLSELETIEIEELGTMEAFTTSGGTSTAPYTFKDRVKNYEYKTIRFPGHCEKMRIFKDFGFWSRDTVMLDGCEVIPRHVFYKVFGQAMKQFEDLDMCAIRGEGWGIKDGHPTHLQVDIFDRQCEKTGFTAMERLTGFSIAIHASAIAQGMVPHGAVRYENALTGGYFLEELQKRDITMRLAEEKS